MNPTGCGVTGWFGVCILPRGHEGKHQSKIKKHTPTPIPELADEMLKALEKLVEIAKEARKSWDADQDMRVGKILIALSGDCPGYRADIDAIHAVIAKAKGGQ